jgi:four helix bundle protein
MNTLQDAKQLQQRTKDFAIRIIRASIRFPKEEACRIIGRQFVRAGTSVAANYRASCRARSRADFISKISIVAEEADETLFWLELLVESQLIGKQIVQPLMSECEQLVKIFSASLTTAKRNR